MAARPDGGSRRPTWTGCCSPLLPDAARVVVLPVDAVVEDDVAELAGLDLGGRLLAAPPPAGTGSASGSAVLNAAANRLGDRMGPATELRRRTYGRHAFDFEAFVVSVLVLTSTSGERRR